jgi:hypothetical protein
LDFHILHFHILDFQILDFHILDFHILDFHILDFDKKKKQAPSHTILNANLTTVDFETILKDFFFIKSKFDCERALPEIEKQ